MTPVVVLGDCLLDVSVVPSGPVRHGGDVPATVTLQPGGQGANIAVRLARRGLPVRLLAPLAEDRAAQLLGAALQADGVVLVVLPAERTGTVVVMRSPDGERTMLSDRPPLGSAWQASLADAMPSASWTVCSGYTLLDDAGPDVAEALASRGSGTRLAIAGAPVLPERAAHLGELIDACLPDLVVLGADEAEALPALPRGVVVVTHPGGARATLHGVTLHAELDASPQPVDTTGAGDAFLAALLAAVGAEPWPPGVDVLGDALRAAAASASEVVHVVGAQGSTPTERALARGSL